MCLCMYVCVGVCVFACECNCSCVHIDEVLQIAKWLACIYRSMDDFQENSTLISSLRGMRVIPLSTGQLVSLDEVTVFMLTEGAGDAGKPVRGQRGQSDK